MTSTRLRRTRLAHHLPPMRSLSPSASPRTGQRLFDWPGLPHRTACACRFSQPLGAFIRPVPGGLVSCHIRSWGRALQSLAPPVQPYAVSDASVCPLVVQTNPDHASRAPKTAETDNHTLRRSAPKTEALEHRLAPATAGRNHLLPNGFRYRPGSAPAFRALLHTKVRHPPLAV
jgi:hypothetical protein